MAVCLGDPEHGYYTTREPFGAAGDFVTAPEISQVFGELIGLWCVSVWTAMGSPERFVLAELGPGRGTMMADLLRAARIRPAFLAAAAVRLVESSPRLRAMQAERLEDAGADLAWCDRIEDLPPGPLILVANEFFDALPIRQFVPTADGWAERVVGLDEAGGLAFGLRPVEGLGVGQPTGRSGPSPRNSSPLAASSPVPAPLSQVPASLTRVPAFPSPSPASPVPAPEPGPNPPLGGRAPPIGPGSGPGRGQWEHPTRPTSGGTGPILERCPTAEAIAEELAVRLAQEGGAALAIDYGHAESGWGDTLQAVRRHRFDPPLAHPGEADLTAHVDFAALARAAIRGGATAGPILTQGAFLTRLGIAQRAEALARGKPAAVQDEIAVAVRRLVGTDEGQMGSLFKVLAFGAPGLPLPAFGGD